MDDSAVEFNPSVVVIVDGNEVVVVGVSEVVSSYVVEPLLVSDVKSPSVAVDIAADIINGSQTSYHLLLT